MPHRDKMKPYAWIAILFALTSCSFQHGVQRINVDYNNTLEDITNELTLLNILRAKEGMPLHYTSVQRLSGSLTFKAIAGLNTQIKANAPTDSRSSTTAVAPAGTTLTDIVNRAVVSGGNIYTPSIGAEVNTGPSFDVNILDSQAFYQGILSSVPLATINNFLLQGFDSERLMSLLAERVEFRLKEAVPNFMKPKGTLLFTMKNDGGDDTDAGFTRLISCYTFSGAALKRPGTPIAPMSRVTDSRERRSLTLQDLAVLDGSKMELSNPISDDPSHDRNIMVIRPADKQQGVQLSRSETCKDPEITINGEMVPTPEERPPPDPLYVGSGQVMVLADDGRSGIKLDADITVIFRSTEGFIQFIGRCLSKMEAKEKGEQIICKSGKKLLFGLRKGSSPDALISSSVLGERYHVAKDELRRETMGVIGLVERLINLQKSATDRPVTVPVQVVP